ncbi:hypothetical protein DWF04_017335 [Cereibacter sphaeroides f. sp. denitrificans]|nr:hypothetical protein DWF04_04775 [Cereibacter sphaeroides f. sp. denitrificans]
MVVSSGDPQKLVRPVGIFWGYLLVAVLTAVVLVSLLALFAVHMVNFSFLSDAACHKIEATRFFREFTYCFYGSDWNEETYLSAVSGFYSTLVAVLVAVQALISWLAFTVIRSSNKQAISEEVEREVPFFFRTKDADKLLQDTLNAISVEAAKEAMKELRKDDDKATEALQNAVYEDLKPTVEGLRGKIEELRVKVDVLLNGEEEDDDDLGKGGNITA